MAVFGPQVKDNILFVEFFRPLESRLPFLDSEKQIAISNVILKHTRRVAEIANSGVSPSVMIKLEEADADQEQEIRLLLTESEFAEYDVRMSKLSKILRDMNLGLDGASFRQAFIYINERPKLESLVLRNMSSLGMGDRPNYDELADIMGLSAFQKFEQKMPKLNNTIFDFKQGSPLSKVKIIENDARGASIN